MTCSPARIFICTTCLLAAASSYAVIVATSTPELSAAAQPISLVYVQLLCTILSALPLQGLVHFPSLFMFSLPLLHPVVLG